MLRLKGARIGRDVKIYGKVVLMADVHNLSIGDNSTLNHGVILNLKDKISVGKHVHISPGAQLHTGFLTLEKIPRVHGSAPIIIEDHVWIASGAVISAGVTIGFGSIVGANALVTENVPRECFVGGVPASIIRTLKIART